MRYLMVLLVALAAWSTLTEAQVFKKWGRTWSEVSGARYHRTVMNRRAAIISAIDGRSYTDYVVKVEPGRHTIVVQSRGQDGFRGSDKTMTLDIAPCRRYYLNAQFDSSVGPQWKPVVDYVERIAGCKVK